MDFLTTQTNETVPQRWQSRSGSWRRGFRYPPATEAETETETVAAAYRGKRCRLNPPATSGCEGGASACWEPWLQAEPQPATDSPAAYPSCSAAWPVRACRRRPRLSSSNASALRAEVAAWGRRHKPALAGCAMPVACGASAHDPERHSGGGSSPATALHRQIPRPASLPSQGIVQTCSQACRRLCPIPIPRDASFPGLSEGSMDRSTTSGAVRSLPMNEGAALLAPELRPIDSGAARVLQELLPGRWDGEAKAVAAGGHAVSRGVDPVGAVGPPSEDGTRLAAANSVAPCASQVVVWRGGRSPQALIMSGFEVVAVTETPELPPPAWMAGLAVAGPSAEVGETPAASGERTPPVGWGRPGPPTVTTAMAFPSFNHQRHRQEPSLVSEPVAYSMARYAAETAEANRLTPSYVITSGGPARPEFLTTAPGVPSPTYLHVGASSLKPEQTPPQPPALAAGRSPPAESCQDLRRAVQGCVPPSSVRADRDAATPCDTRLYRHQHHQHQQQHHQHHQHHHQQQQQHPAEQTPATPLVTAAEGLTPRDTHNGSRYTVLWVRVHLRRAAIPGHHPARQLQGNDGAAEPEVAAAPVAAAEVQRVAEAEAGAAPPPPAVSPGSGPAAQQATTSAVAAVTALEGVERANTRQCDVLFPRDMKRLNAVGGGYTQEQWQQHQRQQQQQQQMHWQEQRQWQQAHSQQELHHVPRPQQQEEIAQQRSPLVGSVGGECNDFGISYLHTLPALEVLLEAAAAATAAATAAAADAAAAAPSARTQMAATGQDVAEHMSTSPGEGSSPAGDPGPLTAMKPPQAAPAALLVDPGQFVEPDGSLLRGPVLQSACNIIRLFQLRDRMTISLPWSYVGVGLDPHSSAASQPQCGSTDTAPSCPNRQPPSPGPAAHRRVDVPLRFVLKLLVSYAGAARAFLLAEARLSHRTVPKAPGGAQRQLCEDFPDGGGGSSASGPFSAMWPLMRRGGNCALVLMAEVQRLLVGVAAGT